MHILTPGHKYGLVAFEGKADPQIIQFIEKKPVTGPDGTVTFTTINDGTTNEEVLRVLIDRLNYLQGKFPCRENAIVITKLEEALLWLNHRTAQRQARGVEGKNAA